MKKIHYQQAVFLLSVASLHQLPPDQGSEVAIIGRSNSGKSSVLNQLTQNKSLARVSKTPGRTQHINLFALDPNHRLADLPGYGYAKVPPAMKHHWENLLDCYFRERTCLKGLILVMDIRHPLKEFDKKMLVWSEACSLPVHILLNKSDKLSATAIKQTVKTVQAAMAIYSHATLQIFSALRGVGIDDLRTQLNQWFD